MRPLSRPWRNIPYIVSKNLAGTLLILTAAFLRLYRLREFVTFLGDQGRDAIVIRKIVTLQHFPAIGAPTSIGQIYLGPFYYYLMSPFLLLSRFDPLGLAAGVALFSIVGLAVAYFVVKKETNVTVALFFLALVAFSFSNIELARFSWNPNLLPIFSFFTLYFFYRTLKDKSLMWAVAFGAFFSFSIQLHYLAIFLLPTFIVVTVWKRIKNKEPLKLLKPLFVSVATFVVFTSPLIVFDLRHNFLNSKNFLALLTQKHVIANTSYLTRFSDTLHALVLHTFQIQLSPLGAIGLVAAVLIAAGWMLFHQKPGQLFASILLLTAVFYILLFSLLDSPKIPHYFGTIYYSFFFLIAYLLSRLFEQKHTFPKAIAITLLLLYFATNAKHYYYFTNKPNNQIEAAKSIASDVQRLVDKKVYQVVSLPDYRTDAHIRYFLTFTKSPPVPEDFPGQPEELFVLCDDPACDILGNPQWQIASFKDKKIDTMIQSGGVTIYKVLHAK